MRGSSRIGIAVAICIVLVVALVAYPPSRHWLRTAVQAAMHPKEILGTITNIGIPGPMFHSSDTSNPADSNTPVQPSPPGHPRETSGTLSFAWGATGLAISGVKGADHNDADGVTIDERGNVYVSGVFRGTFEISGQRLTSRGSGDIFVVKYDRTGTLLWLKQYGGSGDDNIFDIDIAPDQTLVLNGYFANTVDFDGTKLTSRGIEDQVLMKMSPSGSIVWLKQFGGERGDGGNEVIVGSDGNIYATAITQGPFTAGSFTFTHRAVRDSYMLKVSPVGEVLWARGTEGAGSQRLRAVSTDTKGNVYGGYEITGAFKLGANTYSSKGMFDGALAKWNADGDLQWVKYVSGTGDDNVRGIAAGPGGSVYVAGIWSGNTNILGRAFAATEGSTDMFITLIDRSGTPQWVMTIGGSGDDAGGEVESDASGAAYFSTDIATKSRVMRDGVFIKEITSPSNQSSLLLGISSTGGVLSYIYPDVSTASGGQTLGVKADGTMIATSNAFTGTVAFGDQVFKSVASGKNFLIEVFNSNPF